MTSSIIIVVLIFALTEVIDAREYCLTESFTAKCDQDHVIVMDRAWFGRMEMGRCVTRNFGHVGCFVDVIGQLDGVCSGRRTCEMSVSDQILVRTKPCPKDFNSYLDATYTCVKAFTPTMEKCRSVQGVQHTSGHIASFLRKSSSSASLSSSSSSSSPPSFSQNNSTTISSWSSWKPDDVTSCTFHFNLGWGKKVVLSLYDFFPTSPRIVTDPTFKDNIRQLGNHSNCAKMATISEPAIPLVKHVCGICYPSSDDCHWSRHRHVHTSLTNHVVLEIYFDWQFKFLFHYEISGCPPLSTLRDLDVTFDLKGRLKAHCNSTGETFYLFCDDQQWRGEVRNCTREDTIRSLIDTYRDILGLPNIGLSLAIVFGVAMVTVVYVATIMVCIVQVKRWRRKHLPLSMSERRSTKNQLLDSYMSNHHHHHHHQQQNNHHQPIGNQINGSLQKNFFVFTTMSNDGKGRPSSNVIALDENKQRFPLDEARSFRTQVHPIEFSNGACPACCKESKVMTGCHSSLSIGRKKGTEECSQSSYWSNDFFSDALCSDQLPFLSPPSSKNSKQEMDKLNISEDFLSGPDVTSQVQLQSRDCSESSGHRGYGSLLD